MTRRPGKDGWVAVSVTDAKDDPRLAWLFSIARLSG
jgi:hypothetical protein